MASASRPFPPSPRRLANARRAGLTSASPDVVAAAAWLGGLGAIVATAGAAAARLRGWIGDAASGRTTALAIGDAAGAIVALALPIVVAAALAAIVAHLAQTRAPWLPRRRIAGAPTIDPHRARDGAIALARAATIGGVVVAWLWLEAGKLAALSSLDAPLVAAAALAGSALAALAIAMVALAAIDALVRTADHAAALAMTHAEKREDDRLAAPDPRWRRARADATRGGAATLVIVGDGVAIAIAWDPIRRPVPARVAHGEGIAATQLVARARRAHLPIHRDDALARALARGDDRIAEAHWARLAELVAALGARIRA